MTITPTEFSLYREMTCPEVGADIVTGQRSVRLFTSEATVEARARHRGVDPTVPGWEDALAERVADLFSDESAEDGPTLRVGMILDPDHARELARRLVEAADAVDGTDAADVRWLSVYQT